MSAFVMLCCFPSLCFAQTFTDQQIVERIVQDSRNAYYATGHPCAAPMTLPAPEVRAALEAHTVGRAALRQSAILRTYLKWRLTLTGRSNTRMMDTGLIEFRRGNR